MYFIIGFVCFVIGGIAGVVVISLCVASNETYIINIDKELKRITENVKVLDSAIEENAKTLDEGLKDACDGCFGAANNDCSGCTRK